jgi:hypothetical protein
VSNIVGVDSIPTENHTSFWSLRKFRHPAGPIRNIDVKFHMALFVETSIVGDAGRRGVKHDVVELY